MPRARIDLGEKWEASLEKRLLEKLPGKIEAEPRTEREILDLALEEAGGKETVSELKRLYSIQFQRALSDRSAKGAIRRSVSKVLSRHLKSGFSGKFSLSRSRIQIGKSERHGVLLFSDREGARKKVSLLFLKSKESSVPKQVLSLLSKRNFLRYSDLPYQRGSVEKSLSSLFEFGAIAEKIVSGESSALYNPAMPIASEDSAFSEKKGAGLRSLLSAAEKDIFSGGIFRRNFSFSRFLFDRKSGLSERRMSIDLVVFQPENSTLHLCQAAQVPTVASLRELREKADALAVPAHLHLIYKEGLGAGRSTLLYAEKVGITLHGIKL